MLAEGDAAKRDDILLFGSFAAFLPRRTWKSCETFRLS